MSMTPNDIKKFLQLFSITPSEYNANAEASTEIAVNALKVYGDDVIDHIKRQLISEAIQHYCNNNEDKKIVSRTTENRGYGDNIKFNVKLFTFTEETFYKFLKDYTQSLFEKKHSEKLVITLEEQYVYQDREGQRSSWILKAVDDIGVRIKNIESNIECTIPKLYFMNNFYKDYEGVLS